VTVPYRVVAIIITTAVLGGAALGAYLAARGSTAPQVPVAHRNSFLERARARGVIDRYEVLHYDRLTGSAEYGVDSGALRVSHEGGAGGERSGGAASTFPGLLLILYAPAAEAKAEAVRRLTKGFRGKVLLGPLRYLPPISESHGALRAS